MVPRLQSVNSLILLLSLPPLKPVYFRISSAVFLRSDELLIIGLRCLEAIRASVSGKISDGKGTKLVCVSFPFREAYTEPKSLAGSQASTYAMTIA